MAQLGSLKAGLETLAQKAGFIGSAPLESSPNTSEAQPKSPLASVLETKIDSLFDVYLRSETKEVAKLDFKAQLATCLVKKITKTDKPDADALVRLIGGLRSALRELIDEENLEKFVNELKSAIHQGLEDLEKQLFLKKGLLTEPVAEVFALIAAQQSKQQKSPKTAENTPQAAKPQKSLVGKSISNLSRNVAQRSLEKKLKFQIKKLEGEQKGAAHAKKNIINAKIKVLRSAISALEKINPELIVEAKRKNKGWDEHRGLHMPGKASTTKNMITEVEKFLNSSRAQTPASPTSATDYNIEQPRKPKGGAR